MIRRAILITTTLFALTSLTPCAESEEIPHLTPAEEPPRGKVTLKSRKPKPRIESDKTGAVDKKPPLRKIRPANVLAQQLQMAIDIDAQSRSLEAQYRAISSRFATANSITPGSPYVGGSQRSALAGNLRNYNELEMEAGMPLWLPGQRVAFEATVTTGLHEVEQRLALRRLDVAALLRDAWWNARRAFRNVAIARTRVKTAHDIGRDMTRRVELGDAAQGDALLAQNEMLAAETEFAQAEGAAKIARVNYMALTGGALPEGMLESVRREADLDDHPALRTPRAAILRAKAQLRLVDATPIASPDIGVFGRREYNNQYSTDPSQIVSNQRTDSTTIGVRLRIPLPTPGRNAPRRAEAQAEMDRARSEYDRARRIVAAELKAAHAALAAARDASGIAQKRLSVADAQFELSRKSYRIGEVSAFDLYRVRQIQLDAQRMQANAAINVGIAISRLNQALGYAPWMP